jgi:hypothetical protein
MTDIMGRWGVERRDRSPTGVERRDMMERYDGPIGVKRRDMIKDMMGRQVWNGEMGQIWWARPTGMERRDIIEGISWADGCGTERYH